MARPSLAQGTFIAMNRVPALRVRLAALSLLVAMVLPVSFELRLHRQDQRARGVAHVEAQDFQHHADQCLGIADASDQTPLRVPHPPVFTVGLGFVPLPTGVDQPVDAQPFLLPSCRAPPAQVAS